MDRPNESSRSEKASAARPHPPLPPPPPPRPPKRRGRSQPPSSHPLLKAEGKLNLGLSSAERMGPPPRSKSLNQGSGPPTRVNAFNTKPTGAGIPGSITPPAGLSRSPFLKTPSSISAQSVSTNSYHNPLVGESHEASKKETAFLRPDVTPGESQVRVKDIQAKLLGKSIVVRSLEARGRAHSGWAVATMGYEQGASIPGQISFKKGERLRIIDSGDDPSWWVAQGNQGIGYVPSSFLNRSSADPDNSESPDKFQPHPPPQPKLPPRSYRKSTFSKPGTPANAKMYPVPAATRTKSASAVEPSRAKLLYNSSIISARSPPPPGKRGRRRSISDHEVRDLDFAMLMSRLKGKGEFVGQGIRLKQVRRRLHVFSAPHKDVFSGSDFVNWLLFHQYALSREAAVVLGQLLLNYKFIECVHRRHQISPFEDLARRYYRFADNEDEQQKILQHRKGSTVVAIDLSEKKNSPEARRSLSDSKLSPPESKMSSKQDSHDAKNCKGPSIFNGIKTMKSKLNQFFGGKRPSEDLLLSRGILKEKRGFQMPLTTIPQSAADYKTNSPQSLQSEPIPILPPTRKFKIPRKKRPKSPARSNVPDPETCRNSILKEMFHTNKQLRSLVRTSPNRGRFKRREDAVVVKAKDASDAKNGDRPSLRSPLQDQRRRSSVLVKDLPKTPAPRRAPPKHPTLENAQRGSRQNLAASAISPPPKPPPRRPSGKLLPKALPPQPMKRAPKKPLPPSALSPKRRNGPLAASIKSRLTKFQSDRPSPPPKKNLLAPPAPAKKIKSRAAGERKVMDPGANGHAESKSRAGDDEEDVKDSGNARREAEGGRDTMMDSKASISNWGIIRSDYSTTTTTTTSSRNVVGTNLDATTTMMTGGALNTMTGWGQPGGKKRPFRPDTKDTKAEKPTDTISRWGLSPRTHSTSETSFHSGVDVNPIVATQDKRRMTVPVDINKELQKKWKYKKLKDLGRGAFGVVFLAHNITENKIMAVKRVFLTKGITPEIARELENEVTVMQKLANPHIVGMYGCEVVPPNRMEIYMEYVDGNSLDSQIKVYGPFPEPIVLYYTMQILQALHYCHGLGVIHRDIKGKNILVMGRGTIKLADFGSAKLTDGVLEAQKERGFELDESFKFTPQWVAPEVLTGRWDEKVDIWSLGCVVLEMASARAPWYEKGLTNTFQIMYQISQTDEIPLISDLLGTKGREFCLRCHRENGNIS